MPFRDLDDLLSDPQESPSTGRRHPIVVIDDDQTIRDGLEFLLRSRYDVTVCASPREGVSAVNQDTCAVVLDVKMGKLDGFWASAEIRKRFPDMPIIFYSAYQNVRDPFEIINDHRPFGYVAKGESVNKLVEMVDAAVRLQALVISNRRLIESLRKSRKRAR
jgi:DNA-binding NtrC family response regulator